MLARLAALIASTHLLVCLAPSASATEHSARYLFLLRCSGCHGVEGAGVPAGGIPEFRNFIGAFVHDDAGRTYVLHVPGVEGADLNDSDVADVMNYVVMTWAGTSLRNDFIPFTAKEVARRRRQPVEDVVALRRDIVRRFTSLGVLTAAYPWP